MAMRKEYSVSGNASDTVWVELNLLNLERKLRSKNYDSDPKRYQNAMNSITKELQEGAMI